MLGLMCVMYFIAFIDRVNISISSTVFAPEFQLSNTQVGFIISAFALPYLIFQVVGGWIGDKLGPRWTLTISVLIMAMATIAIGFVGGMVSMVIARIVLGIGEGATFPVATRAVSRWIPRERRGWAQGITHASARLGNAVCPPIIAFFMILYSWRGSFFLVGAITLVWAVVWAWYFRDDPHQHPAMTKEELAALPPVPASTQQSGIPLGRLAARMIPVTLVYFSYGWALWLFLGWMPQYFKYNFKLNITHSALFASSIFLAGVVGDVAGGIVTDRLLHWTGSLKIARRNVVVIGLLGALVSLVPMIYVQDLKHCTIFLAAGLFFCEFTVGPMWSLPMDIAPQYSGTATGLMCVGGSFGAFLSPITTGFLIDQTGSWKMPFLITIMLLLAGIVLTFFMHPDHAFQSSRQRLDTAAGSAIKRTTTTVS
jgi:MFS family permease